MSDKAPVVAIIILTWNQRDLTLDCLASVDLMRYPTECLRVVVVDNGSSDGTIAAVKTRFPSVIVVENGENLGFAEGNNAGLRSVLAEPAEYIMLLNNDTVVDVQMLAQLIAVMESRPDVGIVGPKMLYFDPPDVIWSAGSQLGRLPWISRHLQSNQRDTGSLEPPRPVDFICGCGILLRRAVIDQIGLLDARFFIYYEETDWCLRAHHAGWRILYVPSARLWHRVSQAMGATSPATDYYMNRNLFLFIAKNRSWAQRMVMIPAVLLRQLLAIAAYTLKSHEGTRIRHRNARLFALRDAVTGRWGKMGRDVAAACKHA